MASNNSTGKGQNQVLQPCFTPLGIWAFSIGTSIGWGSFVVTCSTYLSQAGIFGTIFGLLLGMAVILVINRNLIYSIERSQNAGGIYTYGRKVCGHDVGFLIGWFLLLAYLSVLWANITSIPLFLRRFFGVTFEIGYCYTVFGYDVYFGEALAAIAVFVLVCILCCRSRRIPQFLNIAMALIFMVSVAACALFAFFSHKQTGFSYAPVYIPDKKALSQIVRIAVISPWAFIGFENAAHFSEELNFPVKKIRKVLLASVILTTLFYILMSLLSVTAYPAEYENWLAYIRDMDNLEGIKAIPAFYAAEYYMGDAGVSILILALLSVILTSLIGNLTALSRLIFAQGRDFVMPEVFGRLNSRQIPQNAILLVLGVSCLIPFLGRTAIGWIVDVTTIGATIIYGFLSYAVWQDARKQQDRTEKISGLLGVIFMIGFAVLLLAPKLMSYETMASESYFIFAAWSLIGLVVFRFVMTRDPENQHGQSVIVWIMLLLLMLLTSMMWVNRGTKTSTEQSMSAIQAYYQDAVEKCIDPGDEAAEFLKNESDRIENAASRKTMISYGLFIVAVMIMLDNYRFSQKREEEWQQKLVDARREGATDALTGVKNNHAYIQWEEKINTKIENGEQEPFALAVCDINNLKYINDTFGHKVGDSAIKDACVQICKVFDHSPVFRVGGDEFVVILMGEDYENRQQLLEQMRTKSEEQSSRQENGIAIGMADFNKYKHASLLSVFEQADKAIYDHKHLLKILWNNREN